MKPALNPDELYSVRQVADMAGKTDERGRKAASQFLKVHNIGIMVAGRRVVYGRDVPAAIERIKAAKPGNPWNRRPADGDADSDTDRKPKARKAAKAG